MRSGGPYTVTVSYIGAQTKEFENISLSLGESYNLKDIARVNPFVKVTEGGAINIAGSNNRYNAIQIDGAMSNDVFGLTSNGANGGQAGT